MPMEGPAQPSVLYPRGDSEQPLAIQPRRHSSSQTSETVLPEAKDQLPGPHDQHGVSASYQIVPTLLDNSTIRPYPTPIMRPFYTVISDATQTPSLPEAHYPRVRYIFSDDDASFLSGFYGMHTSPQGEGIEGHVTFPETASIRSKGNRRPQDPALSDRSILVDLVPTLNGEEYDVVCAASLSADWAVTSTQLRQLDSGTPRSITEDEHSRIMVLDIEGIGTLGDTFSMSRSTWNVSLSPGGGGTSTLRTEKVLLGQKDYSDLVGCFERRMNLLKLAVHNLDERKVHALVMHKKTSGGGVD